MRCILAHADRTTSADRAPQEALKRILGTFKIDVPFFETQSLTYTQDLNIPDASNDLDRELELCVCLAHCTQTTD
jgi:rRNA-processing protein EBP2